VCLKCSLCEDKLLFYNRSLGEKGLLSLIMIVCVLRVARKRLAVLGGGGGSLTVATRRGRERERERPRQNREHTGEF